MEGIDKSIEILCKARELATLVEMRTFVARRKDEINYKRVSEYEYCEIKGKFQALVELEEFLNVKIEALTTKA